MILLRINSIAEATALAIITIEECRRHLRVDDDVFDAEISRCLAAAFDTASRESGCAFGGLGCVLSLVEFPPDAGPIDLRIQDVISVVGVSYLTPKLDVETLSSVDVRLHGSRLFPVAGGWPTALCPGFVRIEFNASSPVPDVVRRAVLLILADYFENHGDMERRQSIPIAAQRLLFQVHSGAFVQ